MARDLKSVAITWRSCSKHLRGLVLAILRDDLEVRPKALTPFGAEAFTSKLRGPVKFLQNRHSKDENDKKMISDALPPSSASMAAPPHKPDEIYTI